jgi:MraZ protein
MLIGEYQHQLDPKKRLAVPAKWRKELGKKVIIAHGLDNCLAVYPLKSWSTFLTKLNQLPLGQAESRSFNRFMLAGAVETEIDGNGRILIPDFLKQYAGLGEQAVLAGVQNRFEIWEAKRWQEYKRQVENQVGDLAQKLGEVGMI